jgi:hypothetical protein
MNEVKIPFGQLSTGAMISIDAVVRGLSCECFCAACGSSLVARKGERNRHHFAHYSEPENCADARETALHKFAKNLICPEVKLHLPDNLELGPMRSAKAEPWLDGIRPDVVAEFDEPVAIEIFVAHRVPTEKIQTLIVRRFAALEIDLSGYRNADKSEDEWRDLVLRTAPRFWLFAPAIVREKIEREAQQAEAIRISEANRIALVREYEERRAAEIRELREWRQRQDAEFEERISGEAKRREKEQQTFLEKRKTYEDQLRKKRQEERQAEKEYQAYVTELKNLDQIAQRATEDVLLRGLKLCADTEQHLKEWEHRKVQLGG